MRILAEADECTRHGQLGALLRREGLYSSSLRDWRGKRDEGAFGALAPKKRGLKVVADPALVFELAKQKKRIGQLEKKLKRAEMIIDVQKKSRLCWESVWMRWTKRARRTDVIWRSALVEKPF